MGSRHVRLPDRGLAAGRRRRPEHLAPLQPHARAASPTATPGTSPATTTGATATTSRLMRELGLKAYRFSVSWSRVLPEGSGRVNAAGPRLLRAPRRRAARRSGIRAVRHALPLGPAGGARRPRRLAQSGHRGLVRRLRARSSSARSTTACELWATLNEPWVVADGGYLHGALAPGHREPLRGADRLAQPAAGARRGGPRLPRRGPARDRPRRQPRAQVSRRRESPEDLAATARADAYMNRQYLDPVLPRALSGGAARDLRRGLAGLPARGDRRRSASRSISSASTTTRAASRGTIRRRLPAAGASRCVRSGAPTRETGWEVYPPG